MVNDPWMDTMILPLNQEMIMSVIDRQKKAREMLDILGITHNGASVAITDLHALFSDEKKMVELVAKLKLKSFW